MKKSAGQQGKGGGKGSKPAAKDITVSISQQKAAGAATGAVVGAIAAGPIGALVGGVVGSLVAGNPEEVKKGLESGAKAVLKKAPTLKAAEKAVVKAGKQAVAAVKGGGTKVKAALASPKAKSGLSAVKKALPAKLAVSAKKPPQKTGKTPASAPKASSTAKKPAGRKT